MKHSRHTFATEMMRSGVSFPALMTLLGHSTPKMTLLYAEFTQTDLNASSVPLVPSPGMWCLHPKMQHPPSVSSPI